MRDLFCVWVIGCITSVCGVLVGYLDNAVNKIQTAKRLRLSFVWPIVLVVWLWKVLKALIGLFFYTDKKMRKELDRE